MMFAHSMSLAITRLALARRGASFTYKLMGKHSQLFEHKQIGTAVKSMKYKEWYHEKQKKEPGKIN
jgi:hypothetical protein